MDVDKEVDSDDDDDDQGPGENPDEEVVVQEEGTPEEDEPVPQTIDKGKTKKAKGKTAHPSFMFTGPASGGAKSISARPTRAEKTLTSTTYLQHLERAKSHVREELGSMGCSVLGRGAEPPQFWVLLIWLEPGISHVTWVHYDTTMCLACFVCSILPVLHFLRFDLCVL